MGASMSTAHNLPEETRFDLGDSGRYNKSVLRNYLLNTEQKLTNFIQLIYS